MHLWICRESRNSYSWQRSLERWGRQYWGDEGQGRGSHFLGFIGRVAAQNMLAQEAEISTVPYLWTAMFGKSLRYAGNPLALQWAGPGALGVGLVAGGPEES